ncbi:MAG: hypothetical protein AAF514_19060, partial [Verrucomicrobiota bacterium]
MIGTLILSKIGLASLISLLAEGLRRAGVRPQFTYAAWFSVVLILLLPPVFSLPLLPGNEKPHSNVESVVRDPTSSGGKVALPLTNPETDPVSTVSFTTRTGPSFSIVRHWRTS